VLDTEYPALRSPRTFLCSDLNSKPKLIELGGFRLVFWRPGSDHPLPNPDPRTNAPVPLPTTRVVGETLGVSPSQFFLANLALHSIDTTDQQCLDEGEDEGNQCECNCPRFAHRSQLGPRVCDLHSGSIRSLNSATAPAASLLPKDPRQALHLLLPTDDSPPHPSEDNTTSEPHESHIATTAELQPYFHRRKPQAKEGRREQELEVPGSISPLIVSTKRASRQKNRPQARDSQPALR
jgi:hypothetical protein